MEIKNKIFIYPLLDNKNKLNKKRRNIKYKNNKKINIIIPIYLSISMFFFINFTFINYSLSKESLFFIIKLNLDSEITMKIKGTGEQRILSRYYGGKLPDIIYVNDNIYINDDKKIVQNLNKNENIIKMVWNSSITTCSGMFCQLSNILDIDLTKFDSSMITETDNMFSDCYSLTSINLNNFNTSKVNNMFNMFKMCRSLTSLDLNQFDTSSVEIMSGMFSGCSSLKELYINNFNTSLVQFMSSLFCECSSLISLDVTNFDTSSVYDMRFMFGYCSSLSSLDLHNFDTSSVYDMSGMFMECNSLLSLDLSNFNISGMELMEFTFYNCSSLIYLNLNSFLEPEPRYDPELDYTFVFQISDDIFSYIKTGVKLCLDIDNNPKIRDALNTSQILNNNNCQDKCFLDNMKLSISDGECITDCLYSNNSEIFEYNKICHSECPRNSYISPYNDHLCLPILNCEKYNKYYNYERTSCINIIPQGYFINDTINQTIDKCHSDCKDCSYESNELNLCIL